MNGESASRLSQISTRWTVFFAAHADNHLDPAKQARRELLAQYGRPVYRYLLAAVGDSHAADDLYQEFALKFVRGELKRASPDRGRFRDFLKTTLYHLVVDYHRKGRRLPATLDVIDVPESSSSASFPGDEEFLQEWRGRLLEAAFVALDKHQRHTGQPLGTVLRLRIANPQETAEQLAGRLAEQLGKAVDAGWVRKRLHYAREKFATLLIDTVKATLDEPSYDDLVRELIDLDLYEWCRGFLSQ